MPLQETGPQLNEKGVFDKIKEIINDNRENLLIVAFVLIIIGGVWAYMQVPQKSSTSNIANETNSASEEIKKTEENATIAPTQNETEEETKEEPKKEAKEEPTKEESNNIASENSGSFTVKAAKGDGLTHVARKALKEYLAKENSENINKEQKIYAEDYLRKHSAYKKVNPNDEFSFKSDLIKEAIEKSKNLNSYQLKNLEKYSALVKEL